jgi:hypothetical protein
MLAALAMSSMVAGCVDANPPCAVRSCPAITKTAAFVPTGLPSPLVDVTGDSNCLAQLTGADDAGADPAVFVQVLILTPGQSTVCQLRGTLADGTVVAATLTFLPQQGCCPDFTPVPSTFAPVDAGADASGDHS